MVVVCFSTRQEALHALRWTFGHVFPGAKKGLNVGVFRHWDQGKSEVPGAKKGLNVGVFEHWDQGKSEVRVNQCPT